MLFQRAMAFAVVPLLFALSAPAQAADDLRGAAREAYERGVALATAGDYQQALAEFQRAYELVPHHAVLYNVAQAERALDNSAKALEAFEMYLREGSEQVPPERRREVEATIAALKAELSTSTSAPAPAPVPEAETSRPSSPVGVLHPIVTVAPPPAPRPAPAAEPSGGGQRTLGYALGILGLGLGGAAVAHWRWNDGRYDDWKVAYDAYQEQPERGAIDGLNEQSRSIERASRVSVGLGIGAAASFGAGVVLLLTSGGSSRPAPTGAVPCAFAGLGVCSRW